MSYLTFQKETVGLYRAVGGSGGLSTMGRASAPPSEAHDEKSALGCACGGGPVRVEVADGPLRHGGVERGPLLGLRINVARRGVDQRPRGFDLGGHVSDHEAQSLERAHG